MSKLDLAAIKALFETGDRPDGDDFIDLIDTLAANSTDLGSSGNNEHEITGIENTTVIDSFVASEWRMVKYIISVSKTDSGANKYSGTELIILIDNVDVNVSEYGMIDNGDTLGTISVSKTSGNIQVILTPDPSFVPVTVRFARMGLKA